jgi:hypothetical protein
MQTLTPAVLKLTQRIREEFDEAPGLQLTVSEGARFWDLEPETCAYILAHLFQSGFLVRAQCGRYRRANGLSDAHQ